MSQKKREHIVFDQINMIRNHKVNKNADQPRIHEHNKKVKKVRKS